MLIGVYGTLRKGYHQNSYLNNTTFVAEEQIEIPYQMYDTGGFPVLLESQKNNKITFEIYNVKDDDKDTIEILDRYEGYPNLYVKTDILSGTGEPVTIYVGNPKSFRSPEKMDIVESGDYIKYKK